MANYANSMYRLTGDQTELKALYELMTSISKEKDNGNWVGHIVQNLNNGEIPDCIYVRGWWDELELDEEGLSFHQESAWAPLYEAWDFIASKFKTIKVYFLGDEPECALFLKRDHPTKRWFTSNYYLDMCTPDDDLHTEYFDTLDEVFRFVEKVTDTNIITIDDLEGLNSAWQEESDDCYIYLHEFKEV